MEVSSKENLMYLKKILKLKEPLRVLKKKPLKKLLKKMLKVMMEKKLTLKQS
jgi:hypothetical protein